MDRNQVKELLPIIQAFSEGKQIQSRCIKGDKSLWYDDDDFSFDDELEYRIKPSPKYRPFKDAEECWNEMLKHQPFGWVKAIKINNYQLFTSISNDENHLRNVFEAFTFADGSVFGVKCEED